MKSQLFFFIVLTFVRKTKYPDERDHVLLLIDYLQSSPLGVVLTWSAGGICTVGFVSPFDPNPGSAVVGCLVVGSVV